MFSKNRISFHFFSGSFCCHTGEGGLEVCRYGDRPHLPMDVHYCVPPGHHWPVPATLASWHDLALIRRYLLGYSNWSGKILMDLSSVQIDLIFGPSSSPSAVQT